MAGLGGEQEPSPVAEHTIIRTIDLPYDQDFAWYADLNVIALSSRLDCAGRLRALDEMQRTWKRQHLTAVQSA